MKIKLAVLEKDVNYLKRIASVFESKYADNIQSFIFTDEKLAIEGLAENKIDVFMANEDFDINIDELPKRCGFAYICDTNDVVELKGCKAIGKFQKVDLIYKAIISIYAEVAENTSGANYKDDSKTKVILFTSPIGGVGTTTMAVACAKYLGRNSRVMYLNLDPMNEMSLYFEAEGNGDFGDVIFAIKSQNPNLSLKVESATRKDNSGVSYFETTKTALDMTELSSDEITQLINILRLSGSYEYIIVDRPFGIDINDMWIYELAGRIVMLSDGSEISNNKMIRAINALTILQDRKELNLLVKIMLTYNKFSSKTSKKLESSDIRNLGGVQKFEYATHQEIINAIKEMEFFENLR
ncbi:MAG: chromosome partitioning protein ParA [Lachnospiraceae bacterium]|nr:chromosome partitioning protein ParA [Lachnospiraceae bacterium]